MSEEGPLKAKLESLEAKFRERTMKEIESVRCKEIIHQFKKLPDYFQQCKVDFISEFEKSDL